ncbi:hypothetical protein PNI0446_01099 [Streptococcus pneumoniae PNI0446]|nr:hypothetical protein PNI0446_01099 [Streptococcus pneumoniae PNI0446]
MLLTSSVLSTTSKQCFEQPAASFLVCSLIFIEYKENCKKQKWGFHIKFILGVCILNKNCYLSSGGYDECFYNNKMQLEEKLF